MRRINAILFLALISCPMASFGEDKKETRSLAAEAAYLAEKSGKNGWVSEELVFKKDDIEGTVKGLLFMRFEADKDKPKGSLVLGAGDKTGVISKQPFKFELVEKDGKRSIKFVALGGETTTLEYSLDADKLTVKGKVAAKTWAAWDVDLTKATPFKVGGK